MSAENEKQEVQKSEEYGHGKEVKDVQNAALAGAIISGKPNPWSKGMFMVGPTFYLSCRLRVDICSSFITVCS
jgi:hypothetical protein